MREHLFARTAPTDRHFRWRGGDVSRVEGLTDAVFGFALTLLVVSLEVPGTFAELSLAIRQIPAFAACFAMLVLCWYYHYLFFRRYGLVDLPTILLNSVLLFVVLIYVYPLKFLTTWLLNPLVGVPNRVAAPDGSLVARIADHEIQPLMLFYGAGCLGVFLVFALMHLRAWAKRRELELDAVERLLTRSALGAHGIMVAVAAASIAIAAADPDWAPASGLIYFLVGPLQFLNGWIFGRRVDALERAAPAG